MEDFYKATESEGPEYLETLISERDQTTDHINQ